MNLHFNKSAALTAVPGGSSRGNEALTGSQPGLRIAVSPARPVRSSKFLNGLLRLTLADERALSLDKGGTLSNVSATDSTVALPDTGKPGVKKLRILSFTGKVLAIDLIGHQATLQLADNQTRTVRVREAVNLADFNPGDTVSVRITETTTILVETP